MFVAPVSLALDTHTYAHTRTRKTNEDWCLTVRARRLRRAATKGITAGELGDSLESGGVDGGGGSGGTEANPL